MEVILREDIEKLGNRGEVVKVAPGYARNFLIPKRLAVLATESNKKIVEQERQAHLRKEAKLVGEAQDLAKVALQVAHVVADAADAEFAEVSEVLADLRRVQVELLGERLGRNGADAGAVEGVQAPQIHRQAIGCEL